MDDIVRVVVDDAAIYLRREYVQGALIVPHRKKVGWYMMTLLVGQGDQTLDTPFANMKDAQDALRAALPEWVDEGAD